MTGSTLLVLLLGLTLLVGFGADWLATRFRVPDVLWLLALGFIAGPLLGLLAPGSLLVIAPVLGAATLVLILFDAGIDLRLSEIRPYLGSALLFALATYFASSALLFVVGYWVLFPGHALLSLLFATALGCTSGAVVIPLARRFEAGIGLRSFLQLDGAFEDALAVVTVTTIVALRVPSPGPLALTVTASLVLPLPVGIAVGLAAGLAWLFFLYGWQDRPFAALATLGFLFVVYAAAEALDGSGILAALVLGVVLGNEPLVRRFLRRTHPFRFSNDLRRVQTEIAFVLRAFFLFLIGMFAVLVNPGLRVALGVGVLVGGLLLLRWLLFSVSASSGRTPPAWRSPVTALYGRGLTSAVLLVVASELIPSVSAVFFPAILLIFGTNVAMTAWLSVRPVRREPAEPEGAEPWVAAAPEVAALSVESPPFLFPTSSGSPLAPPREPELTDDASRPRHPLPRGEDERRE